MVTMVVAITWLLLEIELAMYATRKISTAAGNLGTGQCTQIQELEQINEYRKQIERYDLTWCTSKKNNDR